jgi:predicted secreted protein
MIIVSVILASAIDGSSQELARMYISNEGGDATFGDYGVGDPQGPLE